MGWEAIIMGLLGPIIAQCFNKFSQENPKEYLKAHFDTWTGKLDSSLVRDAMPSTRKAIRKAYRQSSKEDRHTFPRYTAEDVYNMTEAKLLEAMNASDEELVAVFSEAEQLQD